MGLLSDRQGEREPDARVRSIHILIEMCFYNAIVIEADPFTEGVLGDFEPAIDIAPERRGEKKADREGQGFRLESMHQSSFVRGLRQSQPELPTGLLLIGSAGRRQDPAASDRGVLMIDAGRDGERDLDGFGGDDCRESWNMKRRLGM